MTQRRRDNRYTVYFINPSLSTPERQVLEPIRSYERDQAQQAYDRASLLREQTKSYCFMVIPPEDLRK